MFLSKDRGTTGLQGEYIYAFGQIIIAHILFTYLPLQIQQITTRTGFCTESEPRKEMTLWYISNRFRECFVYKYKQ